MRLTDKAQICARLGVLSEKAEADLDALLSKWFVKHYVKGMKLPLLKSMNGTEALKAFEEGLATCSEANVIAAVRKLDPHRTEILSRSRSELVAHLHALAKGTVEPTPKPRPARRPRASNSARTRRGGGVLSQSRH